MRSSIENTQERLVVAAAAVLNYLVSDSLLCLQWYLVLIISPSVSAHTHTNHTDPPCSWGDRHEPLYPALTKFNSQWAMVYSRIFQKLGLQKVLT